MLLVMSGRGTSERCSIHHVCVCVLRVAPRKQHREQPSLCAYSLWIVWGGRFELWRARPYFCVLYAV